MGRAGKGADGIVHTCRKCPNIAAPGTDGRGRCREEMALGSSVVAFVGIAAAAGIPGIALLRAGGGNDGSGEAVGMVLGIAASQTGRCAAGEGMAQRGDDIGLIAVAAGAHILGIAALYAGGGNDGFGVVVGRGTHRLAGAKIAIICLYDYTIITLTLQQYLLASLCI